MNDNFFRFQRTFISYIIDNMTVFLLYPVTLSYEQLSCSLQK